MLILLNLVPQRKKIHVVDWKLMRRVQTPPQTLDPGGLRVHHGATFRRPPLPRADDRHDHNPPAAAPAEFAGEDRTLSLPVLVVLAFDHRRRRRARRGGLPLHDRGRPQPLLPRQVQRLSTTPTVRPGEPVGAVHHPGAGHRRPHRRVAGADLRARGQGPRRAGGDVRRSTTTRGTCAASSRW